MGRKRVAAAYIRGEKYKKLVNYQIVEDLATPQLVTFKLSTNVTENGKLKPDEVYNKILEGEFFISHPERTKFAICWKRSMRLILVKTALLPPNV